MKFQTTSYHFNLLKDEERLAAFYHAILEYAEDKNKQHTVAFDIGCGSGILSFFAQPFFKEIFSCEIDYNAFKCSENNLKDFKNITLLNEDATELSFNKKADLIICEMLDTALIDEEEVPVLNNVKKYLKKSGAIIPQAILNYAQLVDMEREYFHYADVGQDIKFDVLSEDIFYQKVDFLDEIEEEFEDILEFEIKKDGKINGVKLTTVTKLTENIVCGPTPMLNPPLLIPLDNLEVKRNDLIRLKLKYIMGKGIETIKTEIIR